MYRPQLDGLRALAAAAVVVDHFCHLDGTLGSAAVRLFFVLSGFLITGILLESRNTPHRGRAAAVFYARRSLRIFPIYYLSLAVALLLGLSLISCHFVYYATYTTNFLWLTDQRPTAAHLWSLAVEEQFYLLWPWLILYLPKRLLLPALLACIAIGPASRSLGLPPVMTPACLDSLGSGALLAYVGLGRLWIWFLGGAAWVICFGYGDFGQALIFTGVVGMGAKGSKATCFLAVSPLVALGRISYGVYVYHWFVMWSMPPAMRRMGLEIPEGEPWRFVVLTVATLAISIASWLLIERPILSLKRHFKSQPSTSHSSMQPPIEPR